MKNGDGFHSCNPIRNPASTSVSAQTSQTNPISAPAPALQPLSSSNVSRISSDPQDGVSSWVTNRSNRYAPQTLNSPLVEKYLELCVNTGEHGVSLAEIKISTKDNRITSDGQLFDEIRRGYKNIRSSFKAHRFNLFKPIRVNFIQVLFHH